MTFLEGPVLSFPGYPLRTGKAGGDPAFFSLPPTHRTEAANRHMVQASGPGSRNASHPVFSLARKWQPPRPLDIFKEVYQPTQFSPDPITPDKVTINLSHCGRSTV